MTASSYFSMDWKRHAHALAAIATPPGSRWRGPVENIPRHLFVPCWWSYQQGAWLLRDGESDPDAWLQAAYRDQTLVTRVGPLHADHAEPGAVVAGRPTSSSTLPGLVVQMYRQASISDHCWVLDVGTGSGYGIAILCAHVGASRVTAIDVDPYLTEAAAARLEDVNVRPRLLTGDATGPLDGQWDRIVAMVAVRKIPPSWLEALPPGGRPATTLTDTGVILTAERREDGSAVGRIERDQAAFMRTRDGNDYPPRDQALQERALAEDGEHVEAGRYPVLEVIEAWDVNTMLTILAPGIEHHFEARDGVRIAVMTHQDGSWARAEDHDETVTMHQAGPRRLWDFWNLAG